MNARLVCQSNVIKQLWLKLFHAFQVILEHIYTLTYVYGVRGGYSSSLINVSDRFYVINHELKDRFVYVYRLVAEIRLKC